jgi:CRP-like cAMP-binding protein
MTEEELAFMTRFKTGELSVGPGTVVLTEGAPSTQLYTVLSGMGTRYKTLEDGGRQVINFVFPGDFIGLQGGLMGEMKHSVEAATPMVLCVFNRSDLWTMFKTHPNRAFDLTWLSAVEEHFLGETLASIGRRDGQQRLAWGLLRIHHRLRALGMAKGATVPIAFRQQDLADALGLSLVHTNKTLMQFKKSGIARWSERELEIPDLARLAQLAQSPPEPLEPRPLF